MSWDEELARFNEALGRLEQRMGNTIAVHRYVANQEPMKFMQNATVMHAMRVGGGWSVLPIIMLNGRILKQGAYPSLEALTAALDDAACTKTDQ